VERDEFPSGYEDCEKFNQKNPKLLLKAYAYYGATKNTTKQQIFQNLDKFYFPTLTPQDMEGKNSIYVLFLFPSEEVIINRLNKENYDIGQVVAIYDINKFLRGHINKGCYPRETNQFKLSKDNVFFNSHQYLARNDFTQYGVNNLRWTIT
jgi:hypothetical protein